MSHDGQRLLTACCVPDHQELTPTHPIKPLNENQKNFRLRWQGINIRNKGSSGGDIIKDW